MTPLPGDENDTRTTERTKTAARPLMRGAGRPPGDPDASRGRRSVGVRAREPAVTVSAGGDQTAAGGLQLLGAKASSTGVSTMWFV